MNKRSIAQEYFLLVVDENGNMPPMRRDESNAGLVVAGLMDLVLNETVTLENKTVTVVKALPCELAHIASLYEYLHEKPRAANKMMGDYYTGGKINRLITEVGESLLDAGAAVEANGGMFNAKVTHAPKPECKEQVIDVIKAAVAEPQTITPHDVALIHILDGTKNLHQYFSKYESDELKATLKEMKTDPQNKQLTSMLHYVNDVTTLVMAWVLFYFIN